MGGEGPLPQLQGTLLPAGNRQFCPSSDLEEASFLGLLGWVGGVGRHLLQLEIAQSHG